MSVVRHAILVSAALLLMGAIVAAVVTAGCGSNGGTATRRTSDVRSTPAATSTDGVIDVTGTGDLDALTVSEVAVGDEIVVTGSEWTNSEGSVRFYLADEQTESALQLFDLVPVGETMPADDGTISFRFRLAESYERRNGDDVRIEAGQQWYVAAYQDTEPAPGLRGSHGASVGPLTVK